MRSCLLACLLSLAVGAAEPDSRLQQLLLRYPEADTNKDGVLSVEEVQAHARTLRRGKKGSEYAGTTSGRAEAGGIRAKKPVPTHANVSYGPHERNKLDLWLAPAAKPTPLVVFIHGGGFVNGSKDGVAAEMIQGCLDAGVAFMAINYRFRVNAPIQDILRDCARSIQYVRAHAKEYNLDPKRIASYGGSAGAGSSLWLAFHPDLADPKSDDPVLRESSRLVAAGAINTQATNHVQRWPEYLGAPTADWQHPSETAAFYGARDSEELSSPKMKAILAEVDMLGLISADDPPVFMFASQPDGPSANRGHYVHHPGHARAVKRACDAVGVSATVWFAQAKPRLKGNHHTALREFLLRHLGAKTFAR